MNCLKLKLFLLLFSMVFMSSCRDTAVTFSRIEYVIPAHIDIKTAELQSRLTDIKTDSASPYHIVIVLYSYSSGAEKISFAGGDNITTVTAGGRLKALVKVMDGEKILRAEFAEGTGNSMEEMILSLVIGIKSQI